MRARFAAARGSSSSFSTAGVVGGVEGRMEGVAVVVVAEEEEVREGRSRDILTEVSLEDMSVANGISCRWIFLVVMLGGLKFSSGKDSYTGRKASVNNENFVV